MTSRFTVTESSGGIECTVAHTVICYSDTHLLIILGSTGNNYIIYVIPVLIACVLALLIIFITSCLIIRKRQVRKKRVVLNAGIDR